MTFKTLVILRFGLAMVVMAMFAVACYLMLGPYPTIYDTPMWLRRFILFSVVMVFVNHFGIPWPKPGDKELLADATERFVGQGSVVAVSTSAPKYFTVFVTATDPKQDQAVQDWAKEHSVTAEVVISGEFLS